MYIRLIVILFSIFFSTQLHSAKPVIKVSFPPFSPFYHFQNDQPVGYCYEVIRNIFDSIYELDIQDLPLNRSFKALNENQIDLMGCMPCNMPDLEHVSYSIPYINEPILVFYPPETKAKNKTLNQLKNLKGATIRGALTVRYLSIENQLLMDDTNTLVEFIERGRADYGVLPKSMYQQVMKNYAKPVNLETHIIDTIKACVGLSKKSPVAKQLDFINQRLTTKMN